MCFDQALAIPGLITLGVVFSAAWWFSFRQVTVPGKGFFRAHRAEVCAALAVELMVCFVFYHNWYPTWDVMGTVASAASLLGVPKGLLMAPFILVLAACSGWFVLNVLLVLMAPCQAAPTAAAGDRFSGLKALAVCFATAFCTITVCSKSSFLYPLNDWVDANCFFTVGRGMMNGMVVYRDLFEQKGPFIYLLHGIAWLISRDSFFGVYLLEVAACTLFLYYSYRTLRLVFDGKWTVLAIPLSALLIYTSAPFCHGDSVEEFCLPFFAYAIWVSTRSVRQCRDITPVQYLVIGICAGLVFWSKFTLVGFYVGWFLLPLATAIRSRRWKPLLIGVGMIVCGVAIATLPFLIYFGVNGAIMDWLKVYIWDNIFVYSTNSGGAGILSNLTKGVHAFYRCATVFFFACLMGCVHLFRCKERRLLLHWGSMLAVTFLFVYMGGQYYNYYCFGLSVFVPLGIGAAVSFLRGRVKLRFRHPGYLGKVCGAVVLCALLSAVLTPNRYLMGVDKKELPQYQFSEIINQKEDATLLNYGFLDGGFYLTSGITPNCKAFCKLNIPLEEMLELHESYAAQGLCDFIITRDYELPYDHYECVAQKDFLFEGKTWTYYLYQLTE